MSLNGLDDQKIKEAYDTAVAEPGGWFILKYIARDEVELLSRGNGGIVEIRNAIAQCEEPSPLFGFLRYRRRNVLIKFVPEECSRLVQARVTVHFNGVTERFSPLDTIFPITTSKELRDTTLSAACSLHTASGSTSSSTSSLRRRRLMEIAEDAEEELRTKRQSTVPEERPPTAKAPSVSGALPTSSSQPELPDAIVPSANHEVSSDSEDDAVPARESQAHSPTRLEASPRKSSQSARPDIYSYGSYSSSGRPKVKLGPRPSLDVGGRPSTTGASSLYRPVSTLPAGLKLFSRGSKSGKERPKSQYATETPSMTISPPPIPVSMLNPPTHDVPARPQTSGGRPSSRASSFMRPLPSPTFPSTPKAPGITPEKARLLKAMELRKKQMAAKIAAQQIPVSPPTSEHLSSPVGDDRRISTGPPTETHNSLTMLDDMTRADDSLASFDANSTLQTDESDATRLDSYPVSPVGPSEHAASTTASSISESTDETIQEGAVHKEIDDRNLVSSEEKAEGQIHHDPEQPTQESTKMEGSTPGTDQLADSAPAIPESDDISAEKLEPSFHMTAPENGEFQVPEQPVPASANTPSNEPTIAAVEGQNDSSLVPEAEEVVPSSEPDQQPVIDPSSELESEVIPQPPSPSKQMRIPRSKFSVQDLQAVDMAPDLPVEPLPPSASKANIILAEKSPANSTFSEKSRRPKGLIEPIRTDLSVTDMSAGGSDAHFSDDDDLMDELSTAVVEEAKPISVSKSPMSPVFPSPKKQNRFSRVFSAPLRQDTSQSSMSPMLDPSDANRTTPPKSSRSVSAAASYLNKINQEPAKPIAKTVNLGSGISQRIKALEKLSSSNPPAGTTGPTAGVSAAFFSVAKKGNGRASSKSPSIADRANSLTRNPPSPSISRDSSPETSRIRSSSLQNRLDAFNSTSTPTPAPQAPRSRPESISVTARIIRDPAHPYPAKPELGKNPADYAPLDLKQSPLVIDHQKAIVEQPKETIRERRLSKERRLSNASKSTTQDRRSSITIIRDMISDRRTSFSERRKSINLEPGVASPGVKSPSSRPPSVHGQHRPMSIRSRKSSSRERSNGLSPPLTASSLSSNGEDKFDKKSSRASRMMRRMSSSLSAGRKQIASAISPTVREENEPNQGIDSQSLTPSFPSNSSMASSVNIGDVNVQFPDSLLWKRRSVLLDSQGYLLLSPALTAHGSARDKTAGGTLKRFHLSEFRAPCIPDVEMQELPNSVVLDFVEGGGLQVACEDRAGQARTLQTLVEAHRTWAAYGQ